MADFLDRLGDELRQASARPLSATGMNDSNGFAEPEPAFIDSLGRELAGAARIPVVDDSRPPRRERPRAHRLRGRRRLAAMLALAILAAAGVALATRARWDPGPVPPEPHALQIGTVQPRVAAHFAILRRPKTRADAVPLELRVAFSGASGANIGLSRRVNGLLEGRAWMIPGRGALCLLADWPAQDSGGAACLPLGQAMAGRLLLSDIGSAQPPTEFLAGVVPDGVRSVVAHLDDGMTASIIVHENVYLARLHGQVTTVVYSGPAGGVVIGGLKLRAVSRPPAPRASRSPR